MKIVIIATSIVTMHYQITATNNSNAHIHVNDSTQREKANFRSTSLTYTHIQCESKNTPLRFSDIFPKQLGIFEQFLHTYYALPSTLDYQFLFSYL